MRNRAKCKLCKSIIESTNKQEYIECNCGEIFVDGMENLHCGSRNWNNFLRIDDEDNEIVVKVKDQRKPSKQDLINILDEMIKNIENLPSNAMLTPVTHYDLAAALLLLSSIFRADYDDKN